MSLHRQTQQRQDNRRPRERSPWARGAVALVAVVTALGLTACGSSNDPGKKGATNPPRTLGNNAPTGSGTGSGSGSGSGQPDAATVNAIKEAYAKFFSSDTPEGQSLGYLQDGDAFKDAVEGQAGSSLAQQASAEVSKVSLQSANTAVVTFTISLNGKPMLPDYKGYAVREDGKWKVAGKTFCELMTLQNQKVPACSTPEATSLPD